MKKNLNYFSNEERNGLFLLVFILLIFSMFIFLQKRVLPAETSITLIQASIPGPMGMLSYEEKSSAYNESSNRGKKKNYKENKKSYKQVDDKADRKASNKPSYGSQNQNRFSTKNDSVSKPNSTKYKEKKQWKKKNSVEPFSINSQNPLDWEQVYGIGPGYAKRIIKYQKWVGGFHSKEQIKEVYGITDSFYNEFKDQLIISVPYRKIQLNKAQEKELGKHPYLSWKEAKKIIRYRKHHYPIKSVTDFDKIMGIADSTRIKILPYLDFTVEPKAEDVGVTGMAQLDSIIVPDSIAIKILGVKIESK